MENRDVFNSGMNGAQSTTAESEYKVYEERMNTREDAEALTRDVVRKSFLFMFVALIITTIAAVTTPPLAVVKVLGSNNTAFVFIFAELLLVLISNRAIKKNKVILAGVLYTIYAYLTGYMFSIIFLIYRLGSIGRAFGMSAILFGVMAIIGYTTKKDLSKLGNILTIGLLVVIASSFVNLFIFHSSMYELIESAVVLIMFIGITAYDVQKIKKLCAYTTQDRTFSLALLCGFDLYLDFINIFLRILRLMGRRK